MVVEIWRMAATALPVDAEMPATRWEISSVALVV